MEHMVRRRIAARGKIGRVLGVAEIEDRGTGAEGQDHPLRAAFESGRLRQAAAQERHDIGGRGEALRLRRLGERPRPPLHEPALGAIDEFDHRLVALPRVVGPGEDPMLHQDHAGRAGRRRERLGAGLGQVEAGHHIGNDDAVGEDLGDQRLADRLVGQRDDGVGMGVIDVLGWDQRMQDRFDRRVGRGRIHQQAALLAHHLDVRQRVLSIAPPAGRAARSRPCPSRCP